MNIVSPFVCIEQALWKGYSVRKRIAKARHAVRYLDSEEDDDSVLYDEVDLTSWDFAQVCALQPAYHGQGMIA